MAKAVESNSDSNSEEVTNQPQQQQQPPPMDSKYRMIIVAAQRSKQIQRGARPRIDMDAQRHKPTRVALEEVLRGKVNFSIINRK